MTFLESIFYMAWRGLAIGIIMSAPMGPVGMLCIQRTLDKGRRAGLYTGIGAAISDLFYSLLTGFGLSFIEDFLERNQNIIQLVGSFVLIGFGVYLFRKNPSKGLKRPADENVSVEKNIFTGFLFTVSNPLILFLIIGLFARFNFILPASPDGHFGIHIIQYVVGFVFIFTGALLWWWLITFSISKVRSHFNIRSMWLINKCIGIVICLFAVVGIFTSVSALARGADVRCWNSVRGYAPFGSEAVDGKGVLMANPSADTLRVLVSCDGADVIEWRSKVRNPKPGKPWALMLTASPLSGQGDPLALFFDIGSAEGAHDGFSTRPVLEVAARCEGLSDWQPSKRSFADNTGLFRKISSGQAGPDPSGSLNFFKIAVFNDLVTLFGGLHSPERLMSVGLPEGYHVDSIGFALPPGVNLFADELRLSTESSSSYMTLWDDADMLSDYLAASRDPMEGFWQVLDRSLDESLLRLGGDYRLALVRAEDGYDLIYFEGARINPDGWKRGMLKGSLRPSGIKDLWNVTWIDVMHSPLSHELKAQSDANGTLTIQFPYHGSQLRLHRAARQSP